MKSCGNQPLQIGLAALVIAASYSNIISITEDGLNNFTHLTKCRDIQNADSDKFRLIKFIER